MVSSSIGKIFGLYRKYFLARPLTTISSVLVSTAVYLAVLEQVFPGRVTTPLSTLVGLFQHEPQISIRIEPTERYDVGATALTVKRITLVNSSHALNAMNIKVRASGTIDDLKLNINPEAQCRSTRWPSEGKVLFVVSCGAFMEGQKAEINLATTRVLAEQTTVVVEAVGEYGRNKFVGASATGTITNTAPKALQ